MATILIVDDSDTNRKLMKGMLMGSSHLVLEASNGAEGLGLAKVQHPDLIVADILMPKMDGYEFVRELRNDPKTRHVPVVFWTANYAEKEVRSLAERSGVRHILHKPTTIEDVNETIKLALSETPPTMVLSPDDEFRREHLALLNEKILEQVNQLEDIRARQAAILQSAPDAIISMDHEGNIAEFNPAAETMFGYKLTAVIGKPMAEIIIPPALRQKHQRALVHYLATGEGPILGKRLELTGMRSSGDEFPVELTIVRVQLPGAPLFTGFLRDITERKRAENELARSVQTLRRTNDERRTLLTHLVKAQEEERKRVASDVHDDSIQVMAAVSLRLGMLRSRLTDREQLDMIAKLEETVQLSIGRLRQLLFQLAPPALDREGLEAALRAYLQEAFADSDVTHELESGLTTEPSREIRTLVYRIAQEALSNVRKHAKCRRVWVVIDDSEGGLRVKITDDGVGYSLDYAERPLPGHLGLVSMRERAEMLGGWFRIEGQPGRGTTVEFWVRTDGANDLTETEHRP